MSDEQSENASLIAKNVDGFSASSLLDEDTLRSALSYKPRSDDVFIVSYPKCGTTWTQYIVYCILNDGVPPKDFTHFLLRSPWLELLGAEAAEKMVRPGAIKCHFPFDRQPYSKNAKYIYIARNPYDCCVSFYHHVRSIPHYGLQDASFEQFLELFLAGKVGGGDYFDHLLSWYEHRKDPNVLFFRYEDLIKNVRTWVLNIADFLGDTYGQKLRHDDLLLEKVIKSTSFESVKQPVNDGMKNMANWFVLIPPEKQLKSMQAIDRRFRHTQIFDPKGKFIRKGIFGDYKNHFSAEQVQRMKERIALITEKSDVMNLWCDVDLP